MSTIKLTYFPLAARAFPIRLCLRAAGIAFEDERIPFAALGERRGPTGVSDDIPLGQLPVLSIDGKAYTQSMALARWAAKKAGLYPTDDLKALVVDEVTAAIDEVWSKIPRGVPDVAAFKASREDYANKIAPKYYNFIEKRVKESNGPFLLGSELSIADIWITVVVGQLQSGFFDHIPKTMMDSWPALVKLVAAVHEHPMMKEHANPM